MSSMGFLWVVNMLSRNKVAALTLNDNYTIYILVQQADFPSNPEIYRINMHIYS